MNESMSRHMRSVAKSLQDSGIDMAVARKTLLTIVDDETDFQISRMRSRLEARGSDMVAEAMGYPSLEDSIKADGLLY